MVGAAGFALQMSFLLQPSRLQGFFYTDKKPFNGFYIQKVLELCWSR